MMRHLREFENVSAKEDNYCIFIAPKIHRDTLNTFWIANKYEYEGKKQKIIPLNIAQIIEILTAVKTAKADKKMISHIKFKNLLDFIIKDVEISQNCDEWMAKIPVKILSYKESLI
ncbi:AlwI family type II restriction endonuclease [Campylobacter californiensis]|uniref:AlwI family type II restriction endonuclease n=1 Tax=Campylobacter californiensis TaxID=1032243 RepID=UPI002AD4BDF1|nr:AlwI family type II restriction endonuclease [Campylobacter sp. RM12916]